MPKIPPSTAANFITATITHQHNPRLISCAMRVQMPSGKLALHHGMTLAGVRREVADGWPVLGFAIYNDAHLLGAVGNFPAQSQMSLSV